MVQPPWNATPRLSLLEILESFKNGLMARATGGAFAEEDYTSARKTLLGATEIAGKLPRFITTCRNPDEFWSFIKTEEGSYEGRRKIIRDALNPIIDHLENGAAVLAPEIEIGERLGAGGFGVVYKAKHKLLDIYFAVKVFQPSFDDGNRPDMDRFFREARVLFHLNHPNIIRIYDAGSFGGKPFIKMEFFPGRTLAEHLKQHGILPEAKARTFIRKLAEGMAHAHENNVVHRDLKPSNVMLASKEEVRIVDFGLGLFVEADLVSRITKTGERAIGGYYCAPELVADPHLLAHSSDVYSLGALWFTALTGRPPAGVELAAEIDALNLPKNDSKILTRAMATKDRRYKSASEFLADLSR